MNIAKISGAGTGKTWDICNDALNIVRGQNTSTKVMITTYTHKGIESIYSEIKKQNCGIMSSKIIVYTWFQFLLAELIKPYQTFITSINGVSGYDFSETYGKINYGKTGEKARYLTAIGNVRSNHASELAVLLDDKSKGKLLNRLEDSYSHIFIDEAQDLAGYDIDIIARMFRSKIVVTCAGDGKQATFRTHNTKRKKAFSGPNIWSFFEFERSEGRCKIVKNLASRRFNENICSFANYLFSNENNLTTIMDEETGHDGVFLILTEDTHKYVSYYQPNILKYDSRTPSPGMTTLNFGQCKGMTMDRVLILANGTLRDFIFKGKTLSSPYKYYVAVTRAKYSVAIAVESFSNANRFVQTTVNCNGKDIQAMRFTG